MIADCEKQEIAAEKKANIRLAIFPFTRNLRKLGE